MHRFDYLVVGGGLVGLASAYQILTRYPEKKLVLIEKESAPAKHQSGRNSGVIHSGIYYKPGSLKAKNCREGKELLLLFAEKYNVKHEICGKVIVATENKEIPLLDKIFERGQANGVDCEIISSEKLRELEPHVRSIKSIWVKEAGIADYPDLARKLVEAIRELGGEVFFDTKALTFKEEGNAVAVETTRGEYYVETIINAAGLHSDRVLALDKQSERVNRIVPFRGEYYLVKPERDYLCKKLIYPVPNPDFPFLGVHYTRDVHNRVECGPNAVLALSREGYKWTDINLTDILDTVTYAGFWKFSKRYWQEGWEEVRRSLSKAYFVASLARLIPEIQSSDLVPASSGVRAQAMVPEGSLVDDFLIQRSKHCIHILNAPSPAATSCLSIGRQIADLIK